MIELEEAIKRLDEAKQMVKEIIEGANNTLTPNDVRDFAEDAYSEIKTAIEWIEEAQ